MYRNLVSFKSLLLILFIAFLSLQIWAAEPSPEIRAKKMLQRLTGMLLPSHDPLIAAMAAQIKSGNVLQAAKIATGDKASGLPGHPQFLTTLVKQMGLVMSNRAESLAGAELNDFAASMIGVVRDETDARELLTGDFYYSAEGSELANNIPSDLVNDILKSNLHYASLDRGGYDLGVELKRQSGQKLVIDDTGTTANNPDSAGVLTSRTFMMAFGSMGTNRKVIEYLLREFTCTPLLEISDISADLSRIARDVDRAPGGNPNKFNTSCAGCHTVMDGMRGAFAYYTFDPISGIVKNSKVNTSKDPGFGFPADEVDPTTRVVKKYNQNAETYPKGYVTIDNSFKNFANSANNTKLFGWRGALVNGGSGAKQLGELIANSKRFSQCMAKRVFDVVCKPGSESSLKSRISDFERWGVQFEQSGYKLRSLFQNISASSGCF